MKQFTVLIAKKEYGLRIQGSRGKPVHVKIGDRFLVTSPDYANKRDQRVRVMREKKAILNQGYLLTYDQVEELFEIEE